MSKEAYNVNWKYEGEESVTYITKVTDYDKSEEYEQTGSHSGQANLYFDTLEEAIAHSLVPVEEIQFENIPEEEIAAVKDSEEEKEM